MFSNPKLSYLYAFEREFDKLCGNPAHSRYWEQGMWVNAHMSYGKGVSASEGALKFFNDIMKFSSNRAKLLSFKVK